MELYPAIDLRDGRCVRLVEGDFARETVYGDDPVSVARAFSDAGARWIHVVDLDAARRAGDNRGLIAAIVAATGASVEVGGGVRDGSLFDCGVARVVVGSMTVDDPDGVSALSSAHPGQVAIGLDHRGGRVMVRGWEEGAGLGLDEVLARVDASGLAGLIVTDISRDGTLSGPDLEGLGSMLERTALPVIASGGVSSIEDLAALRGLARSGRRLAGVVVGKALYEGRFSIGAALAAVAG